MYFHISRHSLASQGLKTTRPGMERIEPSCSTGWWVGPSSPTPIESCVKIEIVGISMKAAKRIGGRM